MDGSFIGLVGGHEARTADVARSFSEARFHQPDGCVCTIRHGVAEDADDSSLKHFLLDFDYYTEEDQDFDLPRQIETLGAFNNAINELFEWAFPESTRDDFGPRIDPEDGSP